MENTNSEQIFKDQDEPGFIVTILEIFKVLLIALAIVIPIRAFIAQPFKVSGESMLPTFHDKDYLIIDEISYRFEDPKQGDVIVFHPPKNKNIYYIKRIIAIPGDTVDISDSNVRISNIDNPEGKIIDEPYISKETAGRKHIVLGENEYFVMGDNRPNSEDSRVWGVLTKDKIIGRVLTRLYPFNAIDLFPGEHKNYTYKEI